MIGGGDHMRDYIDRRLPLPSGVPHLHVNRPVKIRRRDDNENVKKQSVLPRQNINFACSLSSVAFFARLRHEVAYFYLLRRT